MPCPFFEPQAIVLQPSHQGARLPLLDEYQGRCHAVREPVDAPSALRFRYCNHGYSLAGCAVFPSSRGNCCARFDILTANSEMLELLYVEERDYTPVHWQTLRFSPSTEMLEPAVENCCIRAQALAFCRSYLRQFSGV